MHATLIASLGKQRVNYIHWFPYHSILRKLLIKCQLKCLLHGTPSHPRSTHIQFHLSHIMGIHILLFIRRIKLNVLNDRVSHLIIFADFIHFNKIIILFYTFHLLANPLHCAQKNNQVHAIFFCVFFFI